MIHAENLTGADRVSHSYKRLASKKRLNCTIEEHALMKELKQAKLSGLQTRKVFKEDDSQALFDFSEEYLGKLHAGNDEEEEAFSERDKDDLDGAKLSNFEEIKSFYGESETTFSKNNRSVSTLSRSTLEKGLKLGGSRTERSGVLRESTQSKNKKDFVFFDLFAMYAKNMIEEKRSKKSSADRTLPLY